MRRIILLCFVALIPIAYSQEWHTQIAKAKKLSIKKKKYILMVFEGSDWCRPCKVFEKQILTNDTFLTYASENLILLKLDFPIKKGNQLSLQQRLHNSRLGRKYNPKVYFPYVVLLDSAENIAGTIEGYTPMTPLEYIDTLQSFMSE